MSIFLDIVIPIAAIALLGIILHNEAAAVGTETGVTSIYKTGVADILA